MDMRQLIAQIDHIENKQILNEDAHYATAQVDNRPQVSKSNNQTSIYEMLIKEFGYDVEESTLTENPHANDPAKSAAWAALSPEDQKWLGGADPTDPYILARAPNKGKPAAPAPGGAAASPAAPAVDAGATDMSMGQAGAVNAADTAASATDMSMGQAGAVNAAAGGAAQPAPTTGGDTGEVPGVTTQPGATPAKQPETEPKKKQMAPVDPGTIPLQKWIASKGYDIGKFGADGRWGKDTTKAVDAFWADWKAGKISEPDKQQYQKLLGAAKDTDWTRYWFQKQQGGAAASPAAGNPLNQKPGGQAVSNQSGAETARLARQGTAAPAAKPAVAPATKPAGSGASPATPVDPTKLSVSQRMATEPSIIDQGRAKLGLPAGGTSPTKEDIVKSQDDAILERIRTALFR